MIEVNGSLLATGFFLLWEILIVVSFLHMLYQRRSPTSMIAWLFAMVVVPYLATLVYLVIGTRKIPAKQAKRTTGKPTAQTGNPIEGILRNNGIPEATYGNEVRLIFDGVEAFSYLQRAIREARRTIWISTYVFKDDDVTRRLGDLLIERARAGVTVKLLIDAVGSWGVYFRRKPLRRLKEAGVDVRFFMPIFQSPRSNYINLRNHRKIYLFDQRAVLTGGMNLSEEYLGPTPVPNRWEDMLLYAEGPVVHRYAEVFAADWRFATGERLPLEPMNEGKGEAYMQVVPSGPDIPGDALFEAIVSAAFFVRKRLWIVTPYFVPDEAMMLAQRIAHHKGVDVKLITPRKSNHRIADLARSSYMRELAEEGIDVALYEGNMLHAKAILFDDLGAMLGSVNLDNRSLLLNYEVVSFCYSEAIIRHTERWMQSLLADSSYGLAPASKVRRLGENVMRIFAPQM
ncbi:phospholipase D-like domain-containing protein [Hydrogenimonas urashimensis]|uniref:phospholipase D-like domain-containing protein n=1 Tax=Hydrogenimonas urashimensis TaxID=2740515 RepID=UPI00191684F1|nr:phospholipase D-like domain-containing protein [Hydrogenimonas urashimensis]